MITSVMLKILPFTRIGTNTFCLKIRRHFKQEAKTGTAEDELLVVAERSIAMNTVGDEGSTNE